MDVPMDRRQAYQVYGDPGVGTVDKEWERANMVLARQLPGKKSKLYVHRCVEPFLREALVRCDDAGVLDYITRLGCFNFRHQRHDTRRPLSYHAFGVAIDINPAQNRVWYRTEVENKKKRRGRIPAPFEGEWFKYWPEGVPQDLVDAFVSVGWTWGGNWKSFVDPMHFQLVGPTRPLLPA